MHGRSAGCAGSGNQTQPINIKNPLTGTAFPGNIIPPGQQNSVGIAYLNAFPEPNCSFAIDPVRCGNITNNYVNASNLHEEWNDFDVRGDYVFGPKDTLFARFSWGKDDNVQAPFLTTLPSGFGTGTTFNHPNGASIGWTHIFSPTITNEMHYGYVRTTYGYTPPFANVPICQNLGIPNCNNSADLGGIALIGGNGSQIEYTGDYGPYLVPQTSFDWNDSLTWTKGNHTIKLGGSVIRRQLNLFRPIAGKGFFNLCGNGGANSATGYETSRTWCPGFVCHLSRRRALRHGRHAQLGKRHVRAGRLAREQSPHCEPRLPLGYLHVASRSGRSPGQL